MAGWTTPQPLGRPELERRLGYHPATPVTGPRFDRNRSSVLALAEQWDEELPQGREAALAQTSLQEALMWANAAVACVADPADLPYVRIPSQEDAGEVTQQQLDAFARILGLAPGETVTVLVTPDGVRATVLRGGELVELTYRAGA